MGMVATADACPWFAKFIRLLTQTSPDRGPLQALVILLFAITAPMAHAYCWPGISLVTPDADLIDNGDSTVTHSKTGLMWKQCTEGLSGSGCATGAASAMRWTQALGAATTANVDNFAGHNDWRVPNKKELESIIDFACYGPSINPNRFPNTVFSYYITSTTRVDIPSSNWFIGFNVGDDAVSDKAGLAFVRLVRGGLSVGAFDKQVNGGCLLDIDGNGTQDALTDGLLILRAMFGLTGSSVTNGVIGAGASRTTWAQIQPYLNGSCGTNFAP